MHGRTDSRAEGQKASTVQQFCADHNISRATFYNLLNEGKGPTVMKVGTRTLVSVEAAAEWRRRMEAQPSATKIG
ncbi:putative DNA-binding transcriptional regulator AlpA [Bradyrhizobium niftali]